MTSSKNAPRCNTLKARWGLATRQSDEPDTVTPETTKATPQRKAALLFGVDPDRHCAGQDKHNAKKDERTIRREKIERNLGISLGDTPASKQNSDTISRAFGVTKRH